jgi:LPXTG-motif cell wall-anchored protein
MQLRTLLGTVAALSMTALAGLGVASPALADTYGPQADSAQVSASTVNPGDDVTVSGDGFLAGSIVAMTVSEGGKVYLSDNKRCSGGGGAAFSRAASNPGTVSFTVKPTRAGTNTIQLVGKQADATGSRVLTVKVNVRGGVAGSGSTSNSGTALPHTGGVNFTPLWAGLGLLASGALLVSVAHSRRRILV